ncbi:hypothetical protein N9F42_02050 [Pseudomonadales bacterium]|nr:hypothetical protein [Pseudomonadales bacterium]
MDDKYPYLDEWKIDAVAFKKLEQYIDSNGGTELPDLPHFWHMDSICYVDGKLIDDITDSPEVFLEDYLPEKQFQMISDGAEIQKIDIEFIVDAVENAWCEVYFFQIFHYCEKCILALADTDCTPTDISFNVYEANDEITVDSFSSADFWTARLTAISRQRAFALLSKALLNKKISFL